MSSNIEWIELFNREPGRVKAIAFHPKRTWILISLHDGVAEIWDYRLGTLVDTFDEHDGPIRGVDFHSSQPLFVTAGDDYNVKVWNYRERRCLFTLHGHTDYIRSVQFHPEHPWIITASDDQTVKIWNWQSRQCISTLAGHNHYVMSARFHPTKPLVVSASLDQTIRVWDISGLLNKKFTPKSKFDEQATKIQNELFGSTDVMVKYVLDGHERGVNWADFHPDMPLIISGADDRQIKIWRMSDNRVFEYDILRGHYNNVCAVAFHRKDDMVISVAEDRTIRIWDSKKRTQLYSHRIDKSRCWSLACHPTLNIFAVGHDDGFIIFKLEHERPPHTLESSNGLFFIRDKHMRLYDFESKNESPVLNITGNENATTKKIHYYPKGHHVLVTYSGEVNKWYRLFALPKDGRQIDISDSIKATGHAAVWLRRDRFAVLINNLLVAVKDLKNATKYSIQTPFSIDNIFWAPMERLVLRSEDRICLFDVTQNTAIATETISEVRDVVWSSNSSDAWVAFICNKKVIITDGRLKNIHYVSEPTKVKTGIWDKNGVFIYNTLTHIKYFLRNGDFGIIRTVDRPIYITNVIDDKLFCLDREGKNRVITVDTSEFMFKRALDKQEFGEVMRIIGNSGLVGQAIIGYLEERGYPEIALRFATDASTKFDLAIQCGTPSTLEIAAESAEELQDPDTWGRLGVEALRQGNVDLVSKCYRQTLAFEKLSTLYTYLGKTKKLNSMLSIARDKRKDPNARFQNALLLGDAKERVAVLKDVGQYQLAYITALNHGLTEECARIHQLLQLEKAYRLGINVEQEGLPSVDLPTATPGAKLLFPPIPILKVDSENWPMTRTQKSRFETEVPRGKKRLHEHIEHVESKWGDDELKLSESEDENIGIVDEPVVGGWEDPEFELSLSFSEDDVADNKETIIPLPKAGPTTQELWSQKTTNVNDHIASGSFDSAFKLLNKKFGIVNFEPLRDLFLRIYRANQAMFTGHPTSLPLPFHLNRNYKERGSRHQPVISVTFLEQIDNLKTGYRMVTEGKFANAVELFKDILISVPLVVAENDEAAELTEIVKICKEYIIGISCELERKTEESAERQLEYSIYFAYSGLQTGHQKLALKTAMTLAANKKNYGNAYTLASKLLDFPLSEQDEQRAQKILKHCESRDRTDAMTIDFDDKNPFYLCAHTKKPIYFGTPFAECRYCDAKYIVEQTGELCDICNLSQITESN